MDRRYIKKCIKKRLRKEIEIEREDIEPYNTEFYMKLLLSRYRLSELYVNDTKFFKLYFYGKHIKDYVVNNSCKHVIVMMSKPSLLNK